MYIKIKDPVYDKGFEEAINRAKKKGCAVEIIPDNKNYAIIVKANTRQVGRFRFDLDEDFYILESRLIIEREYYPFEIAVSEFVKILKSKKIRYLLWH